jgi:hypothetical protein
VRQLSFSNGTAYALLADGTVKAWGQDESFLLGNGKAKMTLRPTTVPGLTDIAVLIASGNGVRMLKTDGTALQWGGYQNPVYSPYVVKPSERIRYVAVNAYGFSVFFGSGKVARELTDTFDLTLNFR